MLFIRSDTSDQSTFDVLDWVLFLTQDNNPLSILQINDTFNIDGILLVQKHTLVMIMKELPLDDIGTEEEIPTS